MSDVRLEIQKRHTLNWLIQGAAQHAGMTFHHLVKDELNALDPRLLPYYDQYALINLMQYWQPKVSILSCGPAQFWRQTATDPKNPFFGHPLLSKFGGRLAEAGRQRAYARCYEKGFSCLPVAFRHQVLQVVVGLRRLETPHRLRLHQLARETASTVWGIPQERLEADLTRKIVLTPDKLVARNERGDRFRKCIVGYGEVTRRGDDLIVTGKGTNWQLVAKELVKGTAELICLHGLNELDDDTYQQVINVTDHLDLEPWMLQSGGELWRMLLTSFPDGAPIARVLMHLARLPAGTLESVITTALEQPEAAARYWADKEI
jgi:hypothetical protein